MSKNTLLPDLLITLPVLLLLSLGVLVIYSSDPKLAFQQGILALIGFGIYWLLSFLDFEPKSPIYSYLYFGILILLAIVFVLGMETRGVLRWISLGPFQIQPSEFAKPVLILLLAQFWAAHKTSWQNIFKSFALVLPAILLIFKQPDLGTVFSLIAIWLTILIGANISFLKLLGMSLAILFSTPLLWTFFKDYQKERLIAFFSPAQDPLGAGYNVIQSIIAVGSGQFLGRGLGRGTQSRLQFLPEFRTDFIFASIAEELGFLASIAVLVLYGFLLARCFYLIGNCLTRFKRLLIFGVLGMLFFQVTVNIGMNIGLVPVTGITLPLLSYGGSSIFSTLVSLSFVAAVVRTNKRQIDTREEE